MKIININIMFLLNNFFFLYIEKYVKYLSCICFKFYFLMCTEKKLYNKKDNKIIFLKLMIIFKI